MSLGSPVQPRGFYGRDQLAAEIVAITTFFVLTAILGQRIAADAYEGGWPIVAVAAFSGFIAADFVSGVVHWLGDTWGKQSWPILGRALIRPFREHHVDQTAITRHGFVETNGSSSVGSVILLGVGLGVPPVGEGALFLAAALLSLSSWLFATNQIHKWAHVAAPPPPVAWLQRRGWILDPAHHAVHHSPPFDRYYCITTGWLNPMLTRAGFFPTLERIIRAATGATPRG
ncbi:MAG: fatty acid desaturase CarF family protein [Candidatus Binatia bacterium]